MKGKYPPVETTVMTRGCVTPVMDSLLETIHRMEALRNVENHRHLIQALRHAEDAFARLAVLQAVCIDDKPKSRSRKGKKRGR